MGRLFLLRCLILRWLLLLLLLGVALLALAGAARGGDGMPASQVLHLPAPGAIAETAPAGSLQFIGAATVLIQYQGLAILTDPNFLHKGEQSSGEFGVLAERLTNPALELAALPPIDLIVLSGFQEGHFGLRTRQQLDRNIPIVTTAAASVKLRALGFGHVYPLETWQALTVIKGQARLTVSAMPARHGPLGLAFLLPRVMGTMLDFGAPGNNGHPAYRMYISGDTMVYDGLAEIARRFPNVDLALLHLGGARLLGVVTVSMDAGDGVKMLRLIAPRHAIPIHFDDYDVFKSPLLEFERLVNDNGLMGKISYLKPGAVYSFSASGP